MKALILASGVGKRLQPLIRDKPKALIKVGNNSLLGYQLDNLISCNIRDVIITTGFFENKIKRYIQKNYSNINVTFVNNPKYDITNYIYSMWLTKNLIDDDIILIHGDLLFDKELLDMLINNNYPNCVLVNKMVSIPENDFKAVIENNIVTKIGVDFSGVNAFFSAPLYKFSRLDFLFWLDNIEKFIKKGKTKCYAEDVFNEISDKLMLYPVYFDDKLCMEIDTKEDLERVRRIFSSTYKEGVITL